MTGLKISASSAVFDYKDVHLLLEHLAILFGGAFIAFFLEFSEFLLVQQTSSLTISMAGVFKVKQSEYLMEWSLHSYVDHRELRICM